MKNNRAFGGGGENIAAAYLIKKGYKIAARNFYAHHGEIDIVAYDGQYIVFAEVKTRMNTERSLRFGRPAAAVGAAKQKALTLSAEEYLLKNPSELSPRIDVLELYITSLDTSEGIWYQVDEIVHFENAVKTNSRTKYGRKESF